MNCGLKSPREIHNDIGTLEHPTQISGPVPRSQVERTPVSPLVNALPCGSPAHHLDDVVLGGKYAKQSGPYIATRSGDDGAHICASGSF